MKILFLNPTSIPYGVLEKKFNAEPVMVEQGVAMPMGILYLCSMLERELPEHDLQIIDFAKEFYNANLSGALSERTLIGFIDHCLDLNTNTAPEIVGISVLFSTSHNTSLVISERVKKKWPQATVLMGGMHATNAVKKILDSDVVDYVVRGEAEIGLVDFVRQKLEGKEPHVQGFVNRQKLETGSGCERCELPEDLDDIPLPAWHLIDMAEYVSRKARTRSVSEIEVNKIATIVTSRGCPFLCSFCASWTVHGRKMRYRSVENVISELDQLSGKYKITAIVPEDDLFACKKTHFLKLADAIVERNYGIHWQFPNGLSVAVLNEDVVDAMIRMGMEVINIAIESGSEYVQRHIIKKFCKLDKAKKLVSFCRERGLFTRTYFILGFPGETKEQMLETIEYAKDIKADWCNFHIAAPLVGTEMYDQLLSRGEIDDSFNWDNAYPQERAYETEEITAADIKKLNYDANIDINFFNNINFLEERYEHARSIFSDITQSYPWHIVGHYCVAKCHENLKDVEKMHSTIKHIEHLIKTDNRAADLFKSYKSKMPELSKDFQLI